MKKGTWCEYIDHVLEVVTINYLQSGTSKGGQWRRQIMSQESFPFRIRDILIPKCRTGYVYIFDTNHDKVLFLHWKE